MQSRKRSRRGALSGPQRQTSSDAQRNATAILKVVCQLETGNERVVLTVAEIGALHIIYAIILAGALRFWPFVAVEFCVLTTLSVFRVVARSSKAHRLSLS